MGRVTRSRSEALLRVPASGGLDSLWRWLDALGSRLKFTEGARLVDIWLEPDKQAIVAILDGPDPSSFDWVVDETANVLGLPRHVVELDSLQSSRTRWAFQGEPTSPDPTRPNPRPTRWEWIDVAPDDQKLRIEFVHGVIDGLHHIELHEDDEEVRVTVFLGRNLDLTGDAYVAVGIGAWTTAKTSEPVGHRYVNDGADQ